MLKLLYMLFYDYQFAFSHLMTLYLLMSLKLAKSKIQNVLLSEHLEPGTVVFHCHSAQKQLICNE